MALHWGDYTACYLAVLYETCPTPIETLVSFNEELAERQGLPEQIIKQRRFPG